MKNYITILETICQQSKYLKMYISLCQRTIDRAEPVIYEKHHILPKCFKLGGEKDKDNIVKLTPREHFICHKLLYKSVSDRKLKASLYYAIWQLSRKFSLSAREYENLKLNLSNLYKGIPKTEEHKQALRKPKSNSSKMGRPKGCTNPRKGIKRPEVGHKISESKKGKTIGSDNHFFGKKHTEKTKETLRNKNLGKKQSKETKDKKSIANKGKPAWNVGIPMSEFSKEKASASLSGRRCINNGITNKRVKPEEVSEFLENGWVLGKL